MIVDYLIQKRNGEEISKEGLEALFLGYLKGTVPDYQMSAFLMAVCLQGLSEREIFILVDIFLHSGTVLDLSFISGPKVDKHSTGGVGDKTTLIVAPIVASCGISVVKMSGRGLGYTGGTIDKLEAIPNFKVDLSKEEMRYQVEQIGIVLTSQTEDLTPLDKKIYALRDVTGTVSSIPLIAISIMSKKIAAGVDKIVLDVKYGEGALLRDLKEAHLFAELAVKIGNLYQKEVRIIYSDMSTPLGYTVGNALEVEEAMLVLENKQTGSLLDLCLDLASEMVSLGKDIAKEQALKEVKEALESGRAFLKFKELVQFQKGSIASLDIKAKQYLVKATKTGVITAISALSTAKLALSLGAGRQQKEDKIDPSAGVRFQKQVGDKVEKGEVIAIIYSNKKVKMDNVKDIIKIS